MARRGEDHRHSRGHHLDLGYLELEVAYPSLSNMIKMERFDIYDCGIRVRAAIIFLAGGYRSEPADPKWPGTHLRCFATSISGAGWMVLLLLLFSFR